MPERALSRVRGIAYSLLALAGAATVLAFTPDALARLRAARKAERLARGARFYRVQTPQDGRRFDGTVLHIEGDSMSLVLPEGGEILVLNGYYGSNEVRRLEVVALKPSELPILLIKAVYGLPGDRLRLEEGAKDCWRVIVNDEALRNSEGAPYCVLKERSVALAKAARLHPIIPRDRYLVLGTDPAGTADSTYYGLVTRAWIAARVVRPAAGTEL